jgi:hypothetical protein
MKPIAWKLFGALAVALAVAVAAVGCSSQASNGAQQCQSTACGNGSSLSVCTTNDSNGVCSGITYEFGGQSFACRSCLDCTDAVDSATQACIHAPAKDGGTSSGGGDGGNGAGTCSAKVACGTGGTTYQECTTLGPGGACESISYKTSDNKTFACAGCANCQTAATQLSQYCSTAGGKPSTTCSSAISCGSAGLTYQQCTTTNAGVCESIQYRVSNGSVYTCASCGDCSLATSQLTSYCSSQQGNPTTSCSSSTSCGSLGATYQECTTYSASGTCQSSTYEVSDGVTYACAGCGNCSAAYDQVTSYCASLGNTGETCGATTCGSAATCCYCTSAYECISLTSGLTCADYGCQ